MKTLKELYEIVKAAGGDFPFEVQFRGMNLFFTVLANDTNNNEYSIGQWRDGSVGKKKLNNNDWQFPKDSPYLSSRREKLDPLFAGYQAGNIDAQIINKNRQRWEDLGKPWGRLKEGATYKYSDFESNFIFKKYTSKGQTSGGPEVWNSNNQFISADLCELTDKTLLHLDDWLFPVEDECKYCYGKKQFQWIKVKKVAAYVSSEFMPCPYCNPGEFE